MQVINHLKNHFEKLPQKLLGHKRILWCLFIAITAVMAAGIGKIRIDTSMDAIFPQGHPVHDTYVKYREQFGSDKQLLILYKAKRGDIFSASSLQALQGIHQELSQYASDYELKKTSPLGHIESVSDLINIGFLQHNDEKVMIARNFIGRELPSTEAQRDTLRQQALAHPNYKGTVLSEDLQYGIISVVTDFGAIPVDARIGGDFVDEIEYRIGDLSGFNPSVERTTTKFREVETEEYALFMQAIRELLDRDEYKKAFDFHFVGDVSKYAFDYEIIGPEIAVIFSGIIALFFVILYVSFRNLKVLIWAICVDIAAVVWLMGTLGWVGTVMSDLINPLILLILIVGILDSVHILSGYIFHRKRRNDHHQALRNVFKRSGVACLLTSLTTLFGFLSLAFTELVELRVFGVYAAVGIAYAFIISVVMLPLMIDLWSPIAKSVVLDDPAKNLPAVQKLLAVVYRWVTRNPVRIVSAYALALLALIPGIFLINVDTNPLESLRKSTTIRQHFETMEREMHGTQSMSIFIDAKESGALKDIDMIHAMEELEALIVNHPSGLAQRTGSILIGIKDSNRALNGGSIDEYLIPDDPKLVEQLLFLFLNAHPKRNRELVSDDYSKATIHITLKNRGSAAYNEFIGDIEAYKNRIFASLKSRYPNMEVKLTGGLAILMEMYHLMSWTQIKSFGLALITISLLLLLLFGSWKLGLVAMVPNLVPIVLTFGAMGWFGIPLDVVALIIAPIVIGIVVDDTVHFFTHYRLGLKEYGDVYKALEYALWEVGQAVIFTSAIIGTGLLGLSYSSHMGFTHLGVLGSAAIFVALLSDLLLFPALCLLSAGKAKTEIPAISMASSQL